MDSRVFAVLIGIDHYKSGEIWNLESCVDDAKRMKRWLVDDLGVPKNQIAMLLDEQASKQSMETLLNNHLLNNTRIQKGDAIVIYFAGHGSCLKAPNDWLRDKHMGGNVEVLCPYDHDTRGAEGRIAGISARAMQAFVRDLARTKGNNITLMIDSCFSSPPPRSRDRRYIRWTPTSKAAPEDLYSGLHPCPRRQKHNESFYGCSAPTHTVLAACKPGFTAAEGKEGGRLTSAFLEIVHRAPLHNTPLLSLVEDINQKMGENQTPHYSGHHSDCLFSAVPFTKDIRYIPVQFHSDKKIRIELGSLHGIQKGGELSLHVHNYVGSRNTAIASATVLDVHPTWCIGRSRSLLPKHCWARVPHNHGLSYHRLRKTFQALLHSAGGLHKHASPPQPTVSRASSFSDIKGGAFRSELIETAEAILASKTLFAPLVQ